MNVVWRVMRNTSRIANGATRWKVSYGQPLKSNLRGMWYWSAIWESLHPTKEDALNSPKPKMVNGNPVVGQWNGTWEYIKD
jgi:hypothetical protein